MSRTYPKGMEALLGITLDPDGVWACYGMGDYAFNVAHNDLSDLGDNVLFQEELTGVTVTNGYLDASDIEFPVGTDSFPSLTALVIVFDDVLIAYLDDPATSFPQTLGNATYKIRWNTQGILKLGN